MFPLIYVLDSVSFVMFVCLSLYSLLPDLWWTRNTFCGTWYLPHSNVHNERTVPIIMAHEREGYISTSGLKSDLTVVFLDPDFLYDAGISAIRQLISVILRIFHCACAKRPYFHFLSKIWHYKRVPRPRFPLRRGNFGDSALNKRYIAYFSLRMPETTVFPFPN